MFDLKREMAAWRARLGAEDGLRGTDIDELEDHLCEQVTELASQGLSEEEAFRAATQRLGGTKHLAEEFGKVNGSTVWRRRVTWMISGWLVAVVLGVVVCPLQGVFVLAADEGWLSYSIVGISWPAQLLASLAVNVVGLVALMTVVLRIHGAGAADGVLDRILAWSARRRYWAATILVLILIPFGGDLLRIWYSLVFITEHFRTMAVAWSYAEVFWSTVGPLAMLGFLVWLRRRDHRASRSAPAWMVAGWLVATVLGGSVGFVQRLGFLLAANAGWLNHGQGLSIPVPVSLAVNVACLLALHTVVLRVHRAEANDSFFARILAWSVRRWYWAATILILIPVAHFAAQLWAVRMCPPGQFAAASSAWSLAQIFWTTIGPLAMWGLLDRLRSRDRNANHPALASE